jgi:hypothetical protein
MEHQYRPLFFWQASEETEEDVEKNKIKEIVNPTFL